MSTIPIIDLGGRTNCDHASLRAIGQEIHEACTKIGFFYVINHGIDQGIIETALGAARRFFATPVEEKSETPMNIIFRGYMPPDAGTAERKDGQTRVPGREFFAFGYEFPGDHPDRNSDAAMVGDNEWPSNVPQFRESLYLRAGNYVRGRLNSIYGLEPAQKRIANRSA